MFDINHREGNILKELTRVRESQEGLTPELIMKHFSPLEAMKIAYVPMILTMTAIKYSNALCDYCAERRMSEHKAKSRMLRLVAKEYRVQYFGGMHTLSVRYLERQINTFFEKSEWDETTLWWSISNELKRLYPELEDYELPTYAYMVISIVGYLVQYWRHIDKMVRERVGSVMKSFVDPLPLLLGDICIDFIKENRMKMSKDMSLALKIIGKKIDSLDFEIKENGED